MVSRYVRLFGIAGFRLAISCDEYFIILRLLLLLYFTQHYLYAQSEKCTTRESDLNKFYLCDHRLFRVPWKICLAGKIDYNLTEMVYCCILSTGKVSKEKILKFMKYTKIYSEREKLHHMMFARTPPST